MNHASMGTIAFLLCLLILSADPAQAQIAHENPGNLTPLSPYGADELSAVPAGDLFLPMDSIVASLGSSDFNLSRETVKSFLASYGGLADTLKTYDQPDEQTQLILDRLNLTAREMQVFINSSEAYNRDYADFNTYVAAGDEGNAAQAAARLQAHYASLSSSARDLTDNSTFILDRLSGTDANTTGIENFLVSLNDYTAKVASDNERVSGLTNGTGLLLSSDREEARAGDQIILAARLSLANGSAAGRTIDFYADNLKIGSASTDLEGLCLFNYTAGAPPLKGTLRLSAGLSPQDGLPALASNVVEARRLPEPVSLQISAYPGQVKFGEPAEVRGSLATITGYPVPRRNVSIWIGDMNAGSAKTGTDGSFAYLLNLSGDVPSGQVPLTARYDQSVGDAVLGNTSNPVILDVLQDSTQLSLDSPGGSYRGGSYAVFNGTLLTGGGRPVDGANVSIYANSSLLGTGTTGRDGAYSVALMVPYDFERGSYDLYAAYQPGEGRALAGSSSQVYPVAFEPATPAIAIVGSPALVFPGDRLTVDGILTADGLPLKDRPLDLSLSGEVLATAVTDADGRFSLSGEAALTPGAYTLSVRSAEDRLMAASERGTWPFVAMPFDLWITLLLGGLVLAGVLLAAKFAGVDRALFRKKSREQTTVLPVQPLPSPAEVSRQPESPVPDLPFEREIASIDSFIADGGRARDSLTKIYQALKKLAGSHGLTVEKSDTHRDLVRKLSERDHSLEIPLNTIIFYYENAVFGHYSPSGQDVLNALYCLREVHVTLTGGKGQ